MSLIIGIADGKHVWMGADSGGSLGDMVIPHRDPKMFKVGPMICGFVGYARAIQAAQYVTPPKSKKDPYKYLNKYTIALQKAVNQAMGNENGDDPVLMGLIGYKGKIYSMDGIFNYSDPYISFNAVGVGSEFVLGYLYNRIRGSKPRDMIDHAFRAAKEFYPIIILPPIITYKK